MVLGIKEHGDRLILRCLPKATVLGKCHRYRHVRCPVSLAGNTQRCGSRQAESSAGIKQPSAGQQLYTAAEDLASCLMGPFHLKLLHFTGQLDELHLHSKKNPALIQQKTVYLQSQGWFVASKNPATLDLSYSERCCVL